MNGEQKENFEGYLDAVLLSLKESEQMSADQLQLAKQVLIGFMTNLEQGRLPYRDLEQYQSKQLFEQFPAFRTALDELFRFQRSIRIEDKKDFVATTNAFLASHPVEGMSLLDTDLLSDSDKIKRTGPLNWLKTIMEQVVRESGRGGSVTFKFVEGNNLSVAVTGDLAVQYSARQFLNTFYLDPSKTPTITQVEPSQTIQYTFPQNKIKIARNEYHQLTLLKELLATQGYEVSIPGRKDCATQLFVDAKAVEQRDEAKLLQQWGINLRVADALQHCSGNTVFPFAAHLTVKDEAQRTQFKQYFTQVGILNFDKTAAKQFIINEMGEESLECNISLPNAKALWDYFLRLDTMSSTLKVSTETIRGEDQLARMQRQIRSQSLKTLKNIVGLKDDTRDTFATFFGQSSVSDGIAGEYTEDAYHEKFEDLVNKNCIRGPAAFHLMMGQPAEYSSLAVATSQLVAALEKVSLSEDTDMPILFEDAFEMVHASGTKPTAAYAEYDENRPFANKVGEYLVGLGQQMTPALLSQQMALTAERIGALKTNARSDLHMKLTDIEAFLKTHSPYFFVKTIADKIEALLDSPSVTEEAIEQILTDYGVTDLDQYKIKGMSVFNTYHIKFSLLDIAFNACLKNGLLFPLEGIKQNPEGKAWVTNASSRGMIGSQTSEWVNCIEWSLNTYYPIGWVAGNRNVDTSSNQYAQRGSESQTAKSTYVAGRTGATSRMFVPPTGGTTRDTGASSGAGFTDYNPSS